MSGEMQENSDIAVRLASEETRAGGITTYVLWRAEASLQMERMVSALVTASREANNLFREVSYCSHDPRFDTERDIPDVETSNWRAVCGKTASTVRREGRREPLPYPYHACFGAHHFPSRQISNSPRLPADDRLFSREAPVVAGERAGAT
jgi:hypothetical protein